MHHELNFIYSTSVPLYEVKHVGILELESVKQGSSSEISDKHHHH